MNLSESPLQQSCKINSKDANPFVAGSANYWLLETPIEPEFREHPAVILNAVFERNHGYEILVINLDATESTGAYYAIGGISMKHGDGSETIWGKAVVRDVLDVFGVPSLKKLAGLDCIMCLWHGRSLAIKNPKNNRMHFPEKVSEQSVEVKK